MLEEKLPKIDELARNVDRISLDVDSLKLRTIPPKHDINESLKPKRISIDECKERTARMRAKKDCFVKACSSSFHDNNDEDLNFLDLDAKLVKVGVKRSKLYIAMNPLFWISRNLIMIIVL